VKFSLEACGLAIDVLVIDVLAIAETNAPID
jgi:hypothetical protein